MTVIRRPARSLRQRAPLPESTRKNPTVVAAAVAAAGTVVTGVFSVVGPVSAADREPAEQNCAVVVREYREIVGRDPSMADALTAPRRDGKSILDSDSAAAGCGVDARALRNFRP